MKFLSLTTALLATSLATLAQYNSPWTTNTLNTTQAGYLGIGTKSTSGGTTPLPNFNLQLHGTTDYYITVINPFPQAPSQQSLGKTTRLGLTNTTTGMLETDGAVIRMSDYDFVIENKEAGNATLMASNGSVNLNAPGVALSLSGSTSRAWMGGVYTTSTEYGKFNVTGGNDNCLYLKAPSGKYGLSVRTGNLTDNAIQVVGVDASITRFLVKGNGNTEIVTTSTLPTDKLFVIKTSANNKLLQVTGDGILRSREIIVDAQNWADYVFSSEYKLLSIDELRTYIALHGHLPNVPSTSEAREEGVNVAKTDAILLEKIEELTLYMLQQDNKMKALEAEIEALKAENHTK